MAIVEIKGVKVDVDLREAVAIETLRVGDAVRVLKKNYGDTFSVHSGCVIGFEQFKNLPTIVIAYATIDYSGAKVEFLNYNEGTKDIEVIKADSLTISGFNMDDAFKALDKNITKAEQDLKSAKEQRAFFESHIGKAWASATV